MRFRADKTGTGTSRQAASRLPGQVGSEPVPVLSDDPSQLAIVSAADDGYVMPLAVTIRSAAACLSPTATLHWFILDGGVSDENRQRLEQCFEPNRIALDWVRADREALAGLPVSEHVTLATYFRILIPRLLPPWLEKVIYLDSDLVVLRDLNELWREPLGDHWCLAAQDMAAPYLDAERVLANFHDCARYLASPRPLPNYEELALDGRAKYFNAGVLVIDLARWRGADMTGQLLGCLHEHRRHVLWWDQYALNVVLAGKWGSWTRGGTRFRTSTPARRGGKAPSTRKPSGGSPATPSSSTTRRRRSPGTTTTPTRGATCSITTSTRRRGRGGARGVHTSSPPRGGESASMPGIGRTAAAFNSSRATSQEIGLRRC